MRRRQRSFSDIYNMSNSSMMRRRQLFLLILSALTLHVTVAYVVSPARRSSPSSLLQAASSTTDSSSPEPLARQARVLTPLSTLFSFLLPSSSSAAPASGFDSALKQYFPGALSSSVIALRVVGALRKRDYRPYNTLVASSVCSDEINRTPSSLVDTLEKQLGNTKTGGVFQLGGLGGLPFVGVSGMGALMQHLPSAGSDGKLLMIFGPHVGISESGELGKLQRSGMDKETASCGAAMGAYQAISGATAGSKKIGIMDFQEDYIIENLKKKLGTLASKEAEGGDKTIALVTDKMYDLVYELLKSEVDAVISSSGPDVWKSIQEVTLLGGIIVNRSAKAGGGEDYFQPLTMRTISSKGEDKSIYNEVFGDLLTPRKKV